MDSEPGRCRRTDGRKWRCTRNVIPLQKYCQRHMHRGSRKHVEPIQTDDNRASDDSRTPVPSLVASDVDTRVSTSCGSMFPSILNLKCRNDEARGVMLADSSSISVDHGRSVCSCSRANSFKSSFDGNPMSLSCRKQNFVGNNYVGFDSSRYGLSPKSVLNAAGKVGLGPGHNSTMEPEPQRCRRTDGKKWQCRREAIHSQKYCEVHMHRGAKRVVVKPEYSRHLQSTPTISRNLDSGINLNTVPVPECSRPGTSNNSCSSSSDATTVTD